MYKIQDQDKIDGTKFNSFQYLTQYSDYKENVLYYHFNVYNEAVSYTHLKPFPKISEDLKIKRISLRK